MTLEMSFDKNAETSSITFANTRSPQPTLTCHTPATDPPPADPGASSLRRSPSIPMCTADDGLATLHSHQTRRPPGPPVLEIVCPDDGTRILVTQAAVRKSRTLQDILDDAGFDSSGDDDTISSGGGGGRGRGDGRGDATLPSIQIAGFRGDAMQAALAFAERGKDATVINTLLSGLAQGAVGGVGRHAPPDLVGCSGAAHVYTQTHAHTHTHNAALVVDVVAVANYLDIKTLLDLLARHLAEAAVSISKRFGIPWLPTAGAFVDGGFVEYDIAAAAAAAAAAADTGNHGKHRTEHQPVLAAIPTAAFFVGTEVGQIFNALYEYEPELVRMVATQMPAHIVADRCVDGRQLTATVAQGHMYRKRWPTAAPSPASSSTTATSAASGAAATPALLPPPPPAAEAVTVAVAADLRPWRHQLTNCGLAAFARGHPALTHVDLSVDCHDRRVHRPLSDAGWQALAAACPNLAHLNANRRCLQDGAVTALARGCPNLTSLDLGYCSNVTDAGIAAVAHGCPQLRRVNLEYVTQVTDVGAAALAARCTQLETVNFYNIRRLTDVTVAALAQHCPKLREINVAGCQKLTDVGLVALATKCPKLTAVNLAGDGRITDATVHALAAHCRGLVSLRLCRCYAVTDGGVAQLAQCSGLESLFIWDCANVDVTAASLRWLGEASVSVFGATPPPDLQPDDLPSKRKRSPTKFKTFKF